MVGSIMRAMLLLAEVIRSQEQMSQGKAGMKTPVEHAP